MLRKSGQVKAGPITHRISRYKRHIQKNGVKGCEKEAAIGSNASPRALQKHGFYCNVCIVLEVEELPITEAFRIDFGCALQKTKNICYCTCERAFIKVNQLQAPAVAPEVLGTVLKMVLAEKHKKGVKSKALNTAQSYAQFLLFTK